MGKAKPGIMFSVKFINKLFQTDYNYLWCNKVTLYTVRLP